MSIRLLNLMKCCCNMKFLGRIGKTAVAIDQNTKEVHLTVYDTPLKSPQEKVVFEMRLSKYDAKHMFDALRIAVPYVE